ncbi:MAG: N6-L-threonylcarbamoyladenine synthase [Sphingobacteriales bacterium]|jgi:N6-L-threonylcarbamoyladenine synthase
MSYILGIESSCDDTAAAVMYNGKILSNVVNSQDVHVKYGGVVPELASRAHQQNIIPVVDSAITQAGIKKEDLSAVAFTRGPGLLGPLLVGTSFAKSFAYALDIPLIEVNHIQAHVFAHYIEEPKPKFPYLCLTVSGGHTQIVLIKDYFDMEIVGSTRDDAAGEAFDKSAKLLGLPYPGGPLIDKYAKVGDPTKFKFTKPNIPELNFSFSGLKTGILNFIHKNVQADSKFIENNLNDICASIQHTIVEILLDKVKLASEKYSIKTVAVAGGVSANSGLRSSFLEQEQELGWKVHFPKFEYCTDNAAMIAMVGHYKLQAKEFAAWDVSPLPRG